MASFFAPRDAAYTRACNKELLGRDDLLHIRDAASVGSTTQWSNTCNQTDSGRVINVVSGLVCQLRVDSTISFDSIGGPPL